MKGKQFERNDRVMFASYDKYTEADVPAGENQQNSESGLICNKLK